MFVDLNALDAGSAIEADLCIVGAGAAGISIARHFIGSRFRVCVVESGGFDAEYETHALSEGEVAGVPYFPLEEVRLRMFGGSTMHWGGHCTPFDQTDLSAREWVPYSGWPITQSDLEPYYPAAHELLDLGPASYDPQHWRRRGLPLLDFDEQRLVNRLWQWSPPTRFGFKYREELERSREVVVLLHATVVDIVANEATNAVHSVTVRSLESGHGHVRARLFVLAAGGIENPRMLLLANQVQSVGLGNQHDLVGRFFMEHPHAHVGFAVLAVPLERFEAYYTAVGCDGTMLNAKPGLTAATQRSYRVLNGCLNIGYGDDRSPGYASAKRLGKSLADGRMPESLGADIWSVLRDLDGAAEGLYRRAAGQHVLRFGANSEQEPQPSSRITLGSARDAFGLPVARLDWRLSELDKRSVRVTAMLVAQELTRLGLARVRLDEWLLADDLDWPTSGAYPLEGRAHHMGTTRMHDDPRKGVVDRNCKVHGIANLFVAGSSVFTTSGYANPTMPLVVLAVRLAAHLDTLLAGPVLETVAAPNRRS